MVDVVTVDTDPVEAEGESTNMPEYMNLLFYILQLMLIIHSMSPLLNFVEEDRTH